MNFYVAENGYVGQSVVQSYVWAENEAEAMALATEAYTKAGKDGGYRKNYAENIKVSLVFSSDSPPFATAPSDEGVDKDDFPQFEASIHEVK